jgi:hypothetical protein
VEQGRGIPFCFDPFPMTEEQPMFEQSELIHSYSCADVISEGVLMQVSQTAKDAGLRYPVALTRAVWDRCVTVPPGVRCQDEASRLWDVLYLLRLASAEATTARASTAASTCPMITASARRLWSCSKLFAGQTMMASRALPLCCPTKIERPGEPGRDGVLVGSPCPRRWGTRFLAGETGCSGFGGVPASRGHIRPRLHRGLD